MIQAAPGSAVLAHPADVALDAASLQAAARIEGFVTEPFAAAAAAAVAVADGDEAAAVAAVAVAVAAECDIDWGSHVCAVADRLNLGHATDAPTIERFAVLGGQAGQWPCSACCEPFAVLSSETKESGVMLMTATAISLPFLPVIVS